MVRHISIFFLRRNRRAEEYRAFEQALADMGTRLPSVSGYASGRDCLSRPPAGLPDLPEFGNIAQVIDFADQRAAEGYALHPAHLKLTEDYGDLIEKVAAIDFVVE